MPQHDTSSILWALLTELDTPWKPVDLYQLRAHARDGYWDDDRDAVLGRLDELLARHA